MMLTGIFTVVAALIVRRWIKHKQPDATPDETASTDTSLVAIALIVIMLPTFVHAQTPPQQQAINANEPPSPAQSSTTEPKTESVDANRLTLDEIVVTAQKRAENVRDVPISIAVVSGEMMKEAGIKSFNDAARLLPNVSMNDGSNSLYVRGIGTPELNPLGEQAVAYIIDGVYVPKLSYIKVGFTDLERMEVLKGPQGTLFGRNATAGVINITNASASPDWISDGSFTYGERDIIDGDLMVSGPITDRLRFRVASRYRNENGYIYSITDDDELGERETIQVRGTVNFDVTDSISAKLSLTYFDYFIEFFGNNEFHVYPDDLKVAIGTLDPNLEANFDRRTSLPKHDGDIKQKRSEGDGFIAPLEISWQLSYFTLTSLTAYAKIDDFLGGDTDMTAANLANTEASVNDSQLSQELRITTETMELGLLPGTYDVIGGLYYLDGDADALIEVPIYSDFVTLVNNLVGQDPLTELVAQLQGPLPDEVDRLSGDFELGIQSFGVFGQVRWNVTETLQVLIGARYSRDEKTIDLQVSNDGAVPAWSLATDSPFSYQKTNTFTDFSPKISISWDPIEEVTTYFTYAQGFRAGSFNAGATETGNVEFDAESSDTFEAGVKSELFNNRVRLNVGWFFTEYEDYQLSTFAGLGYVTKNAPGVESTGVEADIAAVIMEGLRFTGSAGYLNAKYTDHSNGACPSEPLSQSSPETIMSGRIGLPRDGCNLTGRGLHRAPRWTSSLDLAYALPAEKSGLPFGFFIGVSSTFRSFEYFDSDLDPIDTQKAYWLLHARLGLQGKDDLWRLEVHGKKPDRQAGENLQR